MPVTLKIFCTLYLFWFILRKPKLILSYFTKKFNCSQFSYRPGSGRGYAPPRQGNRSSTTMSKSWYWGFRKYLVNGLEPEHEFWRALHPRAPTKFSKFDEIIKIVHNLGKKSAINFKFSPNMHICTRSWLKIIIVKFVTWSICILLTRLKNDNFCLRFCILNMFFMYHLGREIGLVPPWVSLGTKVSEKSPS